MSGNGLTDLVRLRNGEVCYWPNLDDGNFGAKVTMDNAPWFDAPDLFDQKRIRLGDVDGSGITDILYLGPDQVAVYLNQAGNGWAAARLIDHLPSVDNLSDVIVTGLFGNGTACPVWSSPLPGDIGRQMRYIDLMGGQKPHLMIGSRKNLGAETRVRYASSPQFYLADEAAGPDAAPGRGRSQASGRIVSSSSRAQSRQIPVPRCREKLNIPDSKNESISQLVQVYLSPPTSRSWPLRNPRSG
jgi:hypothetical protein